MLTTLRRTLDRTSRELVIVQRGISKTSTAPNSDAISRQQKIELKLTENSPNKWIRLNRHNNNRALSTIQTKSKPQTNSQSLVSKDESREFMAVFPDLVRDLTDAGRQTDIPEVTKRYAKSLHYNIPNGKRNRGLSVVASYKMLEKPENLTPEKIRLVNILGWCVELLQGFFVVVDDIMDNAKTRRGVPCWYQKDEIGLAAINDGILIEQGVYTLLKRHFSALQCYVPTLELFHDVTLKTSMGQSLDDMCTLRGKPNLDLFTMSKYLSICKYKSAYYTYHLPVASAMYLADLYDPEMHRQAKTIHMEMGQFFQIQDDFLDCFGDTSVTGKHGNDIAEGKCTWLAVVALQRANGAQRKVMEENYGRPDDEAVQKIRNLYEELSLPNTYAIYEEETYNIIRTHIQQISKGLPHQLFFKLLERMYLRAS